MTVYDFRLDLPIEDTHNCWLNWLLEVMTPTVMHAGLEQLNKFREVVKTHMHVRFISVVKESTFRNSFKRKFEEAYGRPLMRSEYKIGNVDKRTGVITDEDFWRYPFKEQRLNHNERPFWPPEEMTKQEECAKDQRNRDQNKNIQKRELQNNHKSLVRKVIDYIESLGEVPTSKEQVFAHYIDYLEKEENGIDYSTIIANSRQICLKFGILKKQHFISELTKLHF